MAVIENVMQEIAIRLGRDALDIRLANAYPANLSAATEAPPEGRFTPYGQEVIDNLLPEILSRLEKSSEYRTRIAAASSLNTEAPTHLRGIALTPVKFGISFTTRFLNQANALVNVYTDGTVQVSTGATEMGQGVNTKIAQLVAAELGIAVEDVAVAITSTEKNNNTSPTAASAGTDLNGTAAVRAAAAIRARLSDFASRLFLERSPELVPSPADVRFESGEAYDPRRPDERISFAELCDRARRERVDLGARGFYATPGVDFDRDAGRGEPFYYFTTGACVAEVLIDRLTGALRIERLDALLDLGRVLNQGIERGQTIGGLIQGIGWVTAEELVYGDRGELLSSSPTTYKIPGITDLPRVLNLDFLDNDLNRRNVGSGKAVGEPPLMLALSVWAAVKHALSFVAPGEIPDLRLPATHEEILLCISRMERLAKASLQEASSPA
jgi:xanthine dehydrogenase large subunit